MNAHGRAHQKQSGQTAIGCAPDYADHHYLFRDDRGQLLTLPEILGSEDGIGRLITFLKNTNAFSKRMVILP